MKIISIKSSFSPIDIRYLYFLKDSYENIYIRVLNFIFIEDHIPYRQDRALSIH